MNKTLEISIIEYNSLYVPNIRIVNGKIRGNILLINHCFFLEADSS